MTCWWFLLTTTLVPFCSVTAFVPQDKTTLLPIQVVQSMPEWLPSPDSLRNEYYLLRHGQSTSNVQGIISSDRALAYTATHGLTDEGVAQARAAAQPLLALVQARAKPGVANKVTFVASPFARAHQTAQVCCQELQTVLLLQQKEEELSSKTNIQLTPTVALHDALCERNFGRLDGQELFTYAYVWPLDKFNVTHTAFEVESVAAVCHRIRQCIMDLEQEYAATDGTTAHHIVLTSHADVLQITQLYAAQAQNVGEFSSYRFTNGEVRHMTVGSTADLPPPAPLPRPVRGTYIP